MAVITRDLLREERAQAVENALASVRMEGLEPCEETKAIYRRFVDGELTLEAMGHAIDQLSDRDYGPIRLSRNDGP